MIYEDFATANMGFTLAFIIFFTIAMCYLFWKILTDKIEENDDNQ